MSSALEWGVRYAQEACPSCLLGAVPEKIMVDNLKAAYRSVPNLLSAQFEKEPTFLGLWRTMALTVRPDAGIMVHKVIQWAMIKLRGARWIHDSVRTTGTRMDSARS